MDGCGICDPNMLPNGYCHLLVGIYCTLIQTDHYDKRRAIAGTSRMEDRLWVPNHPVVESEFALTDLRETLWRHKVIIVIRVASV